MQVAFDGVLSSIEHIRARKLRALGVASTARLEVLPGIPTIGDFVPGFEASGWNGIGVPKNTSIGIVGRLNKRSMQVLSIRRSRHGLPTWEPHH